MHEALPQAAEVLTSSGGAMYRSQDNWSARSGQDGRLQRLVVPHRSLGHQDRCSSGTAVGLDPSLDQAETSRLLPA